MNRIDLQFKSLREKNQKALVTYLVAGDPDLNETINLMHLCVDSGSHMLEIGVPFTDPIAEGPIIQKAHDRSLKNKTSFIDILETVKEFRNKDNKTPIILMGYLNTFISKKDVLNEIDKFGVDGILVVDVPGELNLNNYGLTNNNINAISLISPTTNTRRVELVAKNSSGFVYYVTLRGVTGSSNLDADEIRRNIAEIKKYTNLPVLAGFGIKTMDDAKKMSKGSDGVVIGSSIVEMINEYSKSRDFSKIRAYLKEISSAIS